MKELLEAIYWSFRYYSKFVIITVMTINKTAAAVGYS